MLRTEVLLQQVTTARSVLHLANTKNQDAHVEETAIHLSFFSENNNTFRPRETSVRKSDAVCAGRSRELDEMQMNLTYRVRC